MVHYLHNDCSQLPPGFRRFIIGAMNDLQKEVLRFLTEYGFRIIGAIIILVAGALLARWLGRVTDQWFTRKQVDPPIKMLAVRIIRVLAFGLALVLALDKCGVPITPMVAGIGVAGVGIGLATQGVLSNIVAGLTIIFTKPFRVGQYIEIAGVQGQVTSVELFTTTLLHPDQSRVVIPNRKIVGEILHNYGTVRQLDLSVGIGYGANLQEALATVREILKGNPRVLKDPAPAVGVALLGDSSVNIGIRPWVLVSDYGAAGAEINQTVLEQFRARQIEIPFPQREIRVLNEQNGAASLAVGADVKRL
jgi:small conductance mechanosensitive channel